MTIDNGLIGLAALLRKELFCVIKLMNMENDNIELRSEKVRKLLGEIPPTLVGWGIVVIILVFVIFMIILYFLRECISLAI